MGSPPCLPQTFTRTYAKKKNPSVSQASCLQNAYKQHGNKPQSSSLSRFRNSRPQQLAGRGADSRATNNTCILVNSEPALHFLRESKAQHSTAVTQELPWTRKDRQGNSPGFLLDTWAFTSTAVCRCEAKISKKAG